MCCGREREETVDCPVDCEYLVEAHRHERPKPPDQPESPHADIPVTEEFLRRNEGLIVLLSQATLRGALETRGVVDSDVREALEGLIRTYRTLQSGLVYETRPDNPIAAGVFQAVQGILEEIRTAEGRSGSTRRLRDADVLGTLVFLRRMEAVTSNGRRKGKAFIEALGRIAPPPEAQAEPTPSLILP